MINSNKPLNMLFECSWEVCNKVGGIYTVLSTKAATLDNKLNGNLFFIGPDIWSKEHPSSDFVEDEKVLKPWKKQAVFPDGMKVRTGYWNIPGTPKVILVSFDSLYLFKNQLYAEMWEHFGVDSLHAYGDYDEACMFAYASSIVIESIALFTDCKNITAHFNEWTTGMGLLYLKAHMPQIATIFTTHATSIGRSICGNNKPLYDQLRNYNGDQMARELNMQSKHSLEKAAAHNADCFTTVSEITAIECEQLLEKRPDVVTPNGFEFDFVPATQAKYRASRRKARSTMLNVASHLLGYEIKDAFIVATSGRNEFRNKGLDVFIDAINVLRHNDKLQDKEILVFVMVPAWISGPRTDLTNELSNTEYKRLDDPVFTHALCNFSQDAIFSKMNYLGMHNYNRQNVKIIYVPSYLNGNDGIFNMSYYDLLPGIDLTAFASYYEPWGYTPLESVAFGIPTITTDLSGFGQWVLSNFGNNIDKTGVKVIHRTDSNYSTVVNELADEILRLSLMSPQKITYIKNAARKTAANAVWDNFIDTYIDAFKIAENARNERIKKMKI